MAQTSGLVLFAHGARDPEWAEPFRDIAKRVAATRADLAVKLAFLEFQSPTLADAITELVDAGHCHIRIAPLFMAQGGHLKKDVPILLDDIRARHPALQLELLPAIGDVAELRDAIAHWLIKATAEIPA
jgi:sirohydrochlorin cobaltochelatase